MTRRTTQARKALIQSYLQNFPQEAATRLEKLSIEEIVRLLQAEPPARVGLLLEHLTPDIASRVLSRIEENFARRFLPGVDPSRTALLLARLDREAQERLLALVDARRAKTLRQLMTYPGDSAGSLMDPRVMTFRPETLVREVLARLRLLDRQRIQDIFVTDPEGHLLGSIPIEEIAISSPGDQISRIARPRPISIHAMSKKEDVVEIMGQYKLTSLPVVDFEGIVIGVIRYDALVTAAQEEVSADIQTMVGASKEERALSKVSFAVRKRLPWLQINLGTAFLAAAVVGIFENTIAQFTALAVLLPVVAGQSGNTGAQALAVTMRGLALREIRLHQWIPVSLKELKTGAINGVFTALVTSIFVFAWSQSFGLALVIGLSMVISMVAAGLSGAAIPMILTAFGQDPAQSSSIILTTITDVAGFLSFLGIATLLAGTL